MRSLRAADAPAPRAVIYLRQSTHRDDSISLELQEIACRDYCDRMGYVVVEVRADPGISGRTWAKRPDVQKAMAAIESGTADVIVLWKWSRLSRSRKDWALAADRVDIVGGRIESATEPIDTATASGRFARGVMTEYAAFQSEQIGETWEEVRQRRLRNGLPASGRLPYGWEWVRGEGIRAHPLQAPVVVEMYKRYLAGDGASEIAKWLNREGIPGPSGTPWTRVRPLTVLDSPIHAGLIPYRGKEHPGAHDGIIDTSTRSAYLAERQRRRVTGVKPRRAEYLLSHLMRCSCGARMSGKGSVTGGRWYGGYLCTVKNAMPDHDGAAYVSALAIHPAVEQWVRAFDVDTTGDADGPLSVSEARRERALRELAALEDEAARILRDRARGDAPAATYDRALAMIRQDVETAEAERAAVERSLAARPDPAVVVRMRELWDFWTVPEQNQALRLIVSHIVLSADGRQAEVNTVWPGISSVLTL